MAQNKKKIKISNPMFDKLQKEDERRKQRKPIFKMDKKTKTRIKAWTGLATFVLGGIKVADTVLAASDNKYSESEKTYIIGLPAEGATLENRGQTYIIDSNSFVIVSGNEALAYDEEGNIQKGRVSGEIEEVSTITEEEMAKYNIYQVVHEDGVNVRTTNTIEDNNIISTVGYQDYVLGCSPTTNEHDGEWIPTLSVDGDNLYEGYIREDLIQEVGNLNLIYDNANETLMKVDTSKDGNINLNLRTRPENFDKRAIKTTIPNGSIVRLIDQQVSENNRSWSHIEYETEKGYKLRGWVATDYLTVYFEGQQNTDGIKTNKTGNVTGIDISSISPNELRQLLENGIPNNVSTTYGNIDTTRVAGNVKFAYIKLGASSYGNGDLEVFDYDSYKEQVQICEEYGIPYGFYYYSTSTTVEEAKIELDVINKRITDLRKEIDMENNKLEIVVDVELSGKNDRQYDGDIEEQTRAKATLINGIQEAGLSDNVLIYGPMRVMRPDLDQIFSLQDLHSMLSNPDDVNLWLCSPIDTNGKQSSNFESEKSYAKDQGFDVVVSQVVLDANVKGRIDIDNMSKEHYYNMVEQTNEITENENTTTQTNEYDER